MNRREVIGGLSAAAILSACSDAKRYPPYRYRLTVEVDTPEGLKTGSSVIEVRARRTSSQSVPSPGSKIRSMVGEAPMVDLGPRGKLFALLSNASKRFGAEYVGESLIPETLWTDQYRQAYRNKVDPFQAPWDAIRALKGPQVLKPFRKNNIGEIEQTYPTLVRFRTLADPASVEEVKWNDLAASFGAGVKLRRITFEITDAEVTWGIVHALPWLATHGGSLIRAPRDVPIDTIRFGGMITDGDFRQGFAR